MPLNKETKQPIFLSQKSLTLTIFITLLCMPSNLNILLQFLYLD